jgi:hypothetical protein
MFISKKIQKLQKIYRFIGKRSVVLILVGIFTGLSLFFVETVFAYVLQAFLVVMRIVPSSATMNFPSWLPSGDPLLFFAFVSLVIVFRGATRWLHSYLISVSYEIQRAFQKKRLVEWAFTTKAINTSDYTTLYNAGIEGVSVTLLHLQNIAILSSTTFFIFFYLLKI